MSKFRALFARATADEAVISPRGNP
jgi:hypothetical protein